MPESENGDGTPRVSHLSPTPPTPSTLSPTWRPPKSPLPPHRLAKLANALGVSTPIPAVHNPNSNSFLSRSYSESSGHMDLMRRSPTPSAASTASFNPYAPTTSKYLLHVIPPMHLPHDSDTFDDDMTPPPPMASGYHTQFRRGTLVPMHATLQAQLGAIAKEYALPSTSGLILYLVSSARPANGLSPVSGLSSVDDEMDEPGPRISEEIWKHLWIRVLRAEQREDSLVLPSRSPNSNMASLGTGIGGRSTPFLPQESNGSLRPLMSSPSIETHPQSYYPFTPAPSTPSSISDLRSNTKSAPPSSSQSEPDTPDTSVEDFAGRANSFDLPGLTSPSIIPILAKVEFDIDKRKAAWYEPWQRSRRVNHAKRAESRASRKNSVNHGDDSAEASQERRPLVQLLIGRKQTASPVSFTLSPADGPAERASDLEAETAGYEEAEATGYGEAEATEYEDAEAAGYEQLSGEDSDYEDDEPEDDDTGEDATARVASIPGGDKDPLGDIFGSDAETWANISAEGQRKSKQDLNPNIVNLALTGAEVSALPDPAHLEDDHDHIPEREVDEVQELLDQMSRPQLSISIPPSPTSVNKDRSSSPTNQTTRKHIPPPLVLIPKAPSADLIVPTEPTPMSGRGDGTNLPYLKGSPEHSNEDEGDEKFGEYDRIRSPADSDKRGGALFEDLDLGLDPTEDFDEDDPNDQRRSQYLMSAQLDEIERTLAQLSPRILKTDLEEEGNLSFHSASLSPNPPPSLTLSPGRNSDFFPSSPRLPQHPDSVDYSDTKANPSWPAVPFSSLKDSSGPTSVGRPDGPPSPPRLALNGVTTSAPKSYMPNRAPSNEISAETVRRKRELEEEQALYPPVPSPSFKGESPSSSPIIPLSPDPFGRYPSTPDIGGDSRMSDASNWDTMAMGRGSIPLGSVMQGPAEAIERSRNSGTTSRFSADSLTGVAEEPTTKASNRATLMSVKSIRKLWRKSKDKNSIVSPPLSTPTVPSSGRTSPHAPPQRPERPSQENMDLPDVPALPPPTPTYGRFSPQLHPGLSERRPSQDQLSAPLPQQLPPQQLPPQQPPPQKLSIPFSGRSANPSPIVAAQMMPGKGAAGLDRMKFDQESPYPNPIRRSPPVRYSPRPPSPPQLPSIPEKEKTTMRKSILKSWKSSSSGSISSAPVPEPQPRSSFERGNVGARGRRPSVINFGSTRTSVTSPDIPPSPQIPEQFINARNAGSQDNRHSKASRMTGSSTDSFHSPPQHQQSPGPRSSSPQRSMTSSRDSGETRPSFDVSQFEIVSPKMGSSLSYPYHGLDHD